MMSITEALPAQKSTIECILDAASVPGLSLGVSQHGKVVHEAHFGYRDVEAQVAPDGDALHNINSLAKALVAAACATLVQDGKPNWTTRLSDVFSAFSASQTLSALTVEDLLSRRSGYYTPDDF